MKNSAFLMGGWGTAIWVQRSEMFGAARHFSQSDLSQKPKTLSSLSTWRRRRDKAGPLFCRAHGGGRARWG